MSHQLQPQSGAQLVVQMVDYDAQVQPGQEVVILVSHRRLYGSDNLSTSRP